MSKKLYNRFLSLISEFAVLLILFMIALEFLFFYSVTSDLTFYYGYIALTASFVLVGAKFFAEFRSFKENLHLLFPSDSAGPYEPLEIDGLDDKSLKVCLHYRNKASFEEIRRKVGLNHPTQAKRELIKGLDFLLKFYDAPRKRVKAT